MRKDMLSNFMIFFTSLAVSSKILLICLFTNVNAINFDSKKCETVPLSFIIRVQFSKK